MKRVLIGLVLIGLLGLGGDVFARGVGLGQGIFSTGSCAAGYDRVAPSQCLRSVGGTTYASVNTTCTALNLTTLYGINSTARAVELATELLLYTGTVAGLEGVTLFLYSDAACTLKLPTNFSTSLTLSDLNANAIATTTTAAQLLTDRKAVIRAWTAGATTIYAKKTELLVTGGSSVVQTNGIFLYYD